MPEDPSLSVSEAVSRAKRALETISARVVGEVSEVSDKAGYKAVYFTLTDGAACMSCLMWMDAYAAAGVGLRAGMMVEVTGSFTAYAPKGRLQFSVRSVALAGEGVLRMQVAELARRLEAEGLMRADRKRPLPRFPARIALVTSPRGKAVWDVIRTLRRRYPIGELVIAGVAVEGHGAVRAIVEGLEAAVAAMPDVIILGRGGGSYEDLMPFNDEAVARAVAASPIPVVTGIGHEPDTTIADMVSDVRASTPTAAAEAAAPAVEEIRAILAKEHRLLARGLAERVREARHRVELMAGRAVLRDPVLSLAVHAQRLDACRAGLARSLPARLDLERSMIERMKDALVREGPRAVASSEERVGRLGSRLRDLSPLAVLERGYAVCYREDRGSVVRGADEVEVGDGLLVRVARGSIACDVTDARVEA